MSTNIPEDKAEPNIETIRVELDKNKDTTDPHTLIELYKKVCTLVKHTKTKTGSTNITECELLEKELHCRSTLLTAQTNSKKIGPGYSAVLNVLSRKLEKTIRENSLVETSPYYKRLLELKKQIDHEKERVMVKALEELLTKLKTNPNKSPADLKEITDRYAEILRQIESLYKGVRIPTAIKNADARLHIALEAIPATASPKTIGYESIIELNAAFLKQQETLAAAANVKAITPPRTENYESITDLNAEHSKKNKKLEPPTNENPPGPAQILHNKKIDAAKGKVPTRVVPLPPNNQNRLN